MKNFYLLSICYLNPLEVDIDLEIVETLESYIIEYPDLSVKLQDYSWVEEFREGCLTFTLSRELSTTEQEQFHDDWTTDQLQLQFHESPKII